MKLGDEYSRDRLEFEETICSDSDIEFVVVFGSRTTGESTGASDIDLAIKFAETLSARTRFEKRCFLSGNLQRENAPFVDISDIETLPIDIAHDAVNGEFVCGERRSFERFKADIEATFDEQSETVRRHQQETIDRIAEGGLRG